MKQEQTHLPPMGRACLIEPTHGLSLVIGKRGVEWCPHSSHVAGKHITPQLLTKQQEWLDAQSAKPVAS